MAQIASAPQSATALYNMYEGDASGRQLSETVAAFLTRLPPLTTQMMVDGPWIYIGNPHYSFRHTSEDRRCFKIRGQEILQDFDIKKAGLEALMAGRPKSAINKQLTPRRKQLERDLLAAAKEKGCSSGKWMLFPDLDHVNSAWSLVATATAENELGLAAKVGTDEGDPNRARLICVYTENFEDKADLKRVLERLYAMGLVNQKGAFGEGKPIYYKADAYTYLDIMGGNEWGLKASLFSSRDILGEGK